MSARWRFEIYSRSTGVRVGQGAYPSAASAHREIFGWLRRNAHGGRPDITRETLLDMDVREFEPEG